LKKIVKILIQQSNVKDDLLKFFGLWFMYKSSYI